MTVRLLVPYGKYPKNSLLTTGAATEAELLRTGQADTNTGAGTAYTDPTPTERSGPTAIESTAGVDLLKADGRTLLNLTSAQALVSGASKLVGDQVAAPTGNITIASVATAGNLTGNYYYAVSYVTATGETAPYIGTATLTGAVTSKQVSLSAIPVSPDSRVTARKLWRSDGTDTSPNNKNYQYLATISDNTTTVYVDNDAANSGIFPSWAATNRALLTDGSVTIVSASDQTTSLGFGTFGNGTPGYACTAIGYNALYDNTSGRRNVAVGVYALENNTTGFENTAVGTHAGGGLTGNIGGNTMIGYAAGSVANTMGQFNTALGAYAFSAAASKGVNNVAVGYGTFSSAVGTLNSCIALGWNAGKYATTSDTIYIDTRDRTSDALAQSNGWLYGLASGSVTVQRAVLNALSRIGCGDAPVVSGLPAASAALKGYRGYVTDSTVVAAANYGATVVGGGANCVPVFCTGSAWIIA